MVRSLKPLKWLWTFVFCTDDSQFMFYVVNMVLDPFIQLNCYWGRYFNEFCSYMQKKGVKTLQIVFVIDVMLQIQYLSV
jgi:hypothetical protein